MKTGKLLIVRMKIGFWILPHFYNLAQQKGVYFLWWHIFFKKPAPNKNIVIDTMKEMLQIKD